LLLVLVAATVALRQTPIYEVMFVLTLAAFVFWFAYRLPWHGYNRFGDYSYGTYLWGWPVQQVVAHHWPTLAPIPHALIASPIAILLGILSWRLVEQPALRLIRVRWSLPRRLWPRGIPLPRIPW
jgi:peptidoglycan/LPS O-acetylase OafA/YrhL